MERGKKKPNPTECEKLWRVGRETKEVRTLLAERWVCPYLLPLTELVTEWRKNWDKVISAQTTESSHAWAGGNPQGSLWACTEPAPAIPPCARTEIQGLGSQNEPPEVVQSLPPQGLSGAGGARPGVRVWSCSQQLLLLTWSVHGCRLGYG